MVGHRIRLIAATGFSMLCASFSGAQSKTTKYTYDPLGRLTFVEDSENGNRDYDYDAAGNRLNVAVGTADDSASEPPSAVPPPGPPKPTDLAKNHVADCAWRASWTLSAGASNYRLRNTKGQSSTIYPTNSTGTATVQVAESSITVTLSCPQGNPQANEPGSVKACNAEGCSEAVSF